MFSFTAAGCDSRQARERILCIFCIGLCRGVYSFRVGALFLCHFCDGGGDRCWLGEMKSLGVGCKEAGGFRVDLFIKEEYSS